MKKINILLFLVGLTVVAIGYFKFFNKSKNGWVYLGRYTTFEVYVDNKTIQKNGRYVVVTTLTNHFLAKGDGEYSNITSEIIDCEKSMVATSKIVGFSEKDGKGKALFDYDYGDEIEWDVVADGNTMGKDVFNLVCNNQKPVF